MKAVVALLALLAMLCLAAQLRGAHAYRGDDWDDTTATQLVELESHSLARAQGAPPKRIQGKIKLNGQFFQTLCECAGADADSNCHQPVRMRVHQQRFNAHLGLSKDDLKDLLGNPQDVVMLDAKRTSFSGVDGRERRAVLGTPGGDFGEFLIAFAAYEALTRQTFGEASIRSTLSNYLGQRLLPVYFATDEEAIQSLADHLHVNGQTHVVVGLDLTNPDELYKSALLEDLVKPQNQGDFFLKAVLAHPKRFYLRKQLVEDLVKAFFAILWDKTTLGSDGVLLSSKINFVVLEGKHEEKAWINFRGSAHCERENRAPAFVPRHGKIQVFVNSPQAASALRRNLAGFFMAQPTKSATEITEDDLFLLLQRQGKRIMEETAQILANNVPLYTVTYE